MQSEVTQIISGWRGAPFKLIPLVQMSASSRFWFENQVERINRSAVRIAKETADDKVYVIGSVGPLRKPVAVALR